LRALVLVSLVTTNIGLIFAHRSLSTSLSQVLGRTNVWLWTGAGGVAAVLAALFLWPAARETFRLAPLHPDDLVLSIAAAVVFVIAAWILRAALSRQA
jgi:Ca2+-transporting ATPase